VSRKQAGRKKNMTNYSIGDFLIKLKNAARAGKKKVIVKEIKLVREVAKVLVKTGVLDGVKKQKGLLEVDLAYLKKEPVLLDLKIVSKPGLRVYMTVDELSGYRKPSMLIISTPEGILTNHEAIKKNVGGEVIAEVLI